MTNKHTPAPLPLDSVKMMLGMVEFCINRGYCMGMNEGMNEDGEYLPEIKELLAFCDSEVNANLIAAAPDMLEVINGYMLWCNETNNTPKTGAEFDKVQAAINKAKGL